MAKASESTKKKKKGPTRKLRNRPTFSWVFDFFVKDAKTSHFIEKSSISGAGLTGYLHGTKHTPNHIPHHTKILIQLIRIILLYIKARTIELLKEGIRKYFHDLLGGKNVLDKSYIVIHQRKKTDVILN